MLKLLESGKFEIEFSDKKYTGQFNTAALRRFSLANGGLDFSQTIDAISINPTLPTLLKFISCAIHEETTDFDVLEIFEQLGGFDSDDGVKLIGHFLDGFVSKKKVTEPNA